jgi:hypothetical protein
MPPPAGTMTICCLGISAAPPLSVYTERVANHCRSAAESFACTAGMLVPERTRPRA